MSSLLTSPISLPIGKRTMPGGDANKADTLQPNVGPVRDMSIKSSFWYQRRSIFTSISIFTCWGLGLLSAPRIAEDTVLGWGLDAAGWALFVVGLGIRLWATLYIGGRKAKGVIDLGPYSICRNPLYWGTLCVLVSQVLMFKSGVFAIGAILPVLIYVLGVVPAEEAYLSQKLGAEYIDYCRRVPRWRPNFSRYNSPDVLEINVKGLKAELRRILGWIWLPFAIQALCVLRTQPWWYAPLNLM